MCTSHHDELWRGFPKTALEFEARFPDEAACQSYFETLRWNGEPACDKCGNKKVWRLNQRPLYDCAKCGHQTSLTSGTLLHGTRKPLRMWFRAVLEMTIRKNGISAKDLQRMMAFGSYETAWTWLHKIRRGLYRENRDPLARIMQLDETLIGGKGSEKALVFIGAEMGGRIRLIHAANNDEETVKAIADREIAADASITTDKLASYNKRSLKTRDHEAKLQTNEERAKNDTLQLCHWTASNVKKWLLGTHHGAVWPKHLQAYLDEFCFRHNRRKTAGVVRIAARALEGLLGRPMSMRQLVDDTLECRLIVRYKAAA